MIFNLEETKFYMDENIQKIYTKYKRLSTNQQTNQQTKSKEDKCKQIITSLLIEAACNNLNELILSLMTLGSPSLLGLLLKNFSDSILDGKIFNYEKDCKDFFKKLSMSLSQYTEILFGALNAFHRIEIHPLLITELGYDISQMKNKKNPNESHQQSVLDNMKNIRNDILKSINQFKLAFPEFTKYGKLSLGIHNSTKFLEDLQMKELRKSQRSSSVARPSLQKRLSFKGTSNDED
jgi:hypothetical protein